MKFVPFYSCYRCFCYRFYRYVIEPELGFEEDGSFSAGPVAVFPSLPQSALLTLQLAVPHSWLVAAVWAPHDLDNIRLAEVEGGGVRGEFQLEHILVEGQCFDVSSDQPTPGMEFVLGSASQPEKFDTIVMANLGYFQLKAGPGAWTLRLRDGRSSQLYSIHKSAHTHTHTHTHHTHTHTHTLEMWCLIALCFCRADITEATAGRPVSLARRRRTRGSTSL